jgi:hypothetical protein
MRNVGRAVAMLVLFGVVAGSAFASTRAVPPALKAVALRPLTVQGTHFQAAEKVKLTLVAGGKTWSAAGTASAAGILKVKFPASATVTACTAYTVRAVRAQGTAVVLRNVPPKTCAAADGKPNAEITFVPTVVVKGQHFKPGESVTVTLVADTTVSKQARASASGSLTVDFGTMTLNSCSAYTLKAVGSLGSRFALTHALVPC